MIRIAVCDDEAYMLEEVCSKITHFFSDKNIEINLDRFHSGVQLLASRHKYDLIFMDIRMDEIDGMEAARELRRREYKGILIFITVLKELVFESFEVQAFDFLVKPIDEVHFHRLMNRAVAAIREQNERRLFIKKNNEYQIIEFDDILFCEVIDRKVYLHICNTEKTVIDYYDRIEHLQEKLDSCFFRCHRSYLIHLKYVQNFKNGTAFMKNGNQIPVSRPRRHEFMECMLQYMKERKIN